MRYLAAALVGWGTLWLGMVFLTEVLDRAREVTYASASEQSSPPPLSLEGNGAIVYFREGTGQVNPYVLFVRNGHLETKALSFAVQSTCSIKGSPSETCPRSVSALTRQVGAGPVYIKGVVRNEAVLVEEMRSSTPEAAGLTIVALRPGEEAYFGEFILQVVPHEDKFIDLVVLRGEERRQARIYSGEIARTYSELSISYAMFDVEKGEYVLVISRQVPEDR